MICLLFGIKIGLSLDLQGLDFHNRSVMTIHFRPISMISSHLSTIMRIKKVW